MEFGVAHAVLGQLSSDRTAPAEGLAAARAGHYEALIRAIDQGDGESAAAAMSTVLGT
jgi:DNA-binding FadR family transcriptional regulator